jgi:polar amino acid transport system substrate-binding protein
MEEIFRLIVRKMLLLLALGLLTAVLPACARQSEAWQRIQQAGVLRVGLDPTYPPFEVADGTAVSGLDVDLARALAQELGLRAEFSYFGYDGLYDALATGQVDVLISALVVVPGRMRDFAYSEPYYNAGEILIVPAAESGVNGMADLAGRRLAVELGAQGHVEATQWAKRLSDLSIRPFPSAAEALAAVAAGDADAALVDSISGRLYLAEQAQPALKRLSEPVTVEPFALVTRIEDETLLDRLNDSLEAMMADGRLEQIIGRWLGD